MSVASATKPSRVAVARTNGQHQRSVIIVEVRGSARADLTSEAVAAVARAEGHGLWAECRGAAGAN